MTLPNKDEVMVWIESVVRPNLIETCGKEEHLAQLLIGKENDEPIAQTMAIYVAAVLFDLAEYDDYETLPTRMEHMTEPQLGEHISRQLRFIQGCETEDTIGSMLIVFQKDNITHCGSTVDPETAPDALRELADRIERREIIKRGQ